MKKYWLLIIALFIGAFLRLYQLGSIPNALTWDEAALGYNAYSILKTGRDEFGKFLPIIFKSFGDYKPGLYVYLAVPAIAIFGLNEFAVRFPGAIFGILAIWGVYLLIKELFKDEKYPDLLASFTALVLAIMPLHIHFSRGAWETNVYTTLLLFSICFFLKFIRTGKYLNLVIILSLFSFITYQAAKMFTPLAIGLTIIIYWRDFWKNFFAYFEKTLNRGIIIFSLALVISLFISTVSGDTGNRLTRMSLFSYEPKLTTSFWNNRPQLMSRLIADRYFNHLTPKLLFFEGLMVNERGHLPNLGVLQPFDFIALFLGLIFLANYKKKKTTILIIGLLLLSPLPGTLTLSEYSTVRSFFMTIPLSLICGLGLYFAYSHLKIIFAGIVLITFVMTIYLFDNLFVHANFTYAKEYQYGYREAIKYINQNPDTNVLMTDIFGQPYIFYLFYSKFDPATYQKMDSFVSGGIDVGRVKSVGRIEFRQFGTGDIINQKNTIFIGNQGNFYDQKSINSVTSESFDILYPNGFNTFHIIKTKAQ